MFLRTIRYRLKTLMTGAFGIVCFVLAAAVALIPFIGLIMPDALIPIGWIDKDNTPFSKLLLDGVNALDVVWVTHDEQDTLIANLQTGRLEAVFIVKEGFEQAMEAGRYEDTLIMLRSPYSTAAGVISESVGGAAMSLWATCAAANEARSLSGEALYARVFEDAQAGMYEPILRMQRVNQAGQMPMAAPLRDAAGMSLRLLAAVAGFFMLTGLLMPRREDAFYARLRVRGLSAEGCRLSQLMADASFMLPLVAIPLAVFWLAGEGLLVLPLLLLFALYLLSLGGVAAMVAGLREQTAQLLLISLFTIANVLLGGLLMPLPSGGLVGTLAHILPARWLSSAESHGVWLACAGLLVTVVVYNAIPFVCRRRRRVV